MWNQAKAPTLRNWFLVGSYLRKCAWATDTELQVSTDEIICESYQDKKGNQQNENTMELVAC
ncbi:uncharacterized protein LACBIDRAFT_303295 [Laccaria bicolor S238N-H82]|uniref:Predicted protein n=1 Tax=Laccaria bicolor (strain S238N-H82 / ATCC MYA-4686) TaxID=486041 RepID=B0DE69_LACBS|nr:uncharacterized protein LACBIDRAFT_298863 [Laccaria bicolor S238N-H82]XP_001883926.1 uncharacterized protein LACBIDRAFT_303295 [Laccaria bicolor S238N-H82]EDR05368.1 predicted protein [Laccaria bicolor S238N-H82]EDR07212.1 predicted protein [Laccaria bicolor S238N-H82]|eukprot:XP_001882143.1 predicted protein [Laccaria bicolor S238N-H82]